MATWMILGMYRGESEWGLLSMGASLKTAKRHARDEVAWRRKVGPDEDQRPHVVEWIKYLWWSVERGEWREWKA